MTVHISDTRQSGSRRSSGPSTKKLLSIIFIVYLAIMSLGSWAAYSWYTGKGILGMAQTSISQGDEVFVNDHNCTVGAVWEKDGNKYGLFAGHCGKPGDKVSKPYFDGGLVATVGTILAGEFSEVPDSERDSVSGLPQIQITPEAGDWAVFSIDMNLGSNQYSDIKNNYADTRSILAFSSTLCMYGDASGEVSCGMVKPELSIGNFVSVMVVEQSRGAIPGDSGGPVYNDGNGKFTGLVSARSESIVYVYNPIPSLMAGGYL